MVKSDFFKQRIISSIIFFIASALIQRYQNFSPHNHSFTNPKFILDEVSTKKLDSGILKATSNGKAVFIQDINAPSSIIWEIISNYDSSVQLRLLNDFVQIRYHTISTFDENNDLLISKLKTSEFHNVKELNGVWHIGNHPDKEKSRKGEWSRACYAIDLIVLSFLPKWVNDYVSEKVMMQSMYWVKIEAEQRWKDKKRSNFFRFLSKQSKNDNVEMNISEKQLSEKSIGNFDFVNGGYTIILKFGDCLWIISVASAWFLGMSIVYLAFFYNGIILVQRVYTLDEDVIRSTMIRRRESDEIVIL